MALEDVHRTRNPWLVTLEASALGFSIAQFCVGQISSGVHISGFLFRFQKLIKSVTPIGQIFAKKKCSAEFYPETDKNRSHLI